MSTVSTKRIAIFLPSLAGGGAERVMLNVAHGLARKPELDVDLVVADLSGPYVDQVGDELHLVDLGAGRISRSPLRLRAYIEEHEPAVVISALDLANLTSIAVARTMRNRPRVIVTEHSALSVKLSLSKPTGRLIRWFQAILPTLIGLGYRFADQAVSVSHGVADDLSEMTGLPRDLVAVVGNPVVTDEVREKAAQPAEHPWLTDAAGPPVLIGVGRLSIQKDFPVLLRAFQQVRAKREARLIILGEGPERSNLEALIDELGIADDVSLPGFVSNPYAEMAAASLFVLSSQYEGLPTVLIESLYCDTPVVSTDCKAGPNEILQGGLHGHLVAVGEPAALAAAIDRALAELDENKRQTGWEDFTEEAVIAQYARLLDTVS